MDLHLEHRVVVGLKHTAHSWYCNGAETRGGPEIREELDAYPDADDASTSALAASSSSAATIT